MAYEAQCPECNNTNGEHKPWCTKHTEAAKWLGLRQCDFKDLTFNEIIERIADDFATEAEFVLDFVDADIKAMSKEDATIALFNKIDDALYLDNEGKTKDDHREDAKGKEIEDDGFITFYLPK